MTMSRGGVGRPLDRCNRAGVSAYGSSRRGGGGGSQACALKADIPTGNADLVGHYAQFFPSLPAKTCSPRVNHTSVLGNAAARDAHASPGSSLAVCPSGAGFESAPIASAEYRRAQTQRGGGKKEERSEGCARLFPSRGALEAAAPLQRAREERPKVGAASRPDLATVSGSPAMREQSRATPRMFICSADKPSACAAAAPRRPSARSMIAARPLPPCRRFCPAAALVIETAHLSQLK